MNGLAVGPAKVKFKVGRPRGTNFTGKVVVAANNVVHFFGAPDFIGKLQREINKQEIKASAPVKLELDKLAPALRKGIPARADIRSYFDKNRLVLELFKSGPPPVVR